MNNLLLVIDMQNGFMDEKSEHIISNIKALIASFEKNSWLVAFTRFINYPDSPWVKWIKWSKLMNEPEIEIIPELKKIAKIVFDKPALYTAFTDEFQSFVKENNVSRIFICGLSTDGCVLKTAVDCFERNIESVVIDDASFSHGGRELHYSGLKLLERFIGERQIMRTGEVLDVSLLD